MICGSTVHSCQNMEFTKVKEEPGKIVYDDVSQELLAPEIQIKQEPDFKVANCQFNSYKDLKQLAEEYDCSDSSYMEDHYDR